MNKNNSSLIKFDTDISRLSRNEKDVLRLLVEAGELIAPLYIEQEEQAKGISKEEVEQAAKKDPSIKSPYTVVEKINGKLTGIPYHIKYIEFLKPIAEKLEKAAKLTDNKDFCKALKVQAEVLLNGSYEKAIAVWFKIKPYILDISIGPVDHYDDRIFYGKASYQAWVGILDEPGTNKLNKYKSVILSAQRKSLSPKKRINNLSRVKARVDDVVLFSGLMARVKFVGVNLPMNVELVEKYGSEVTLFNQPNDLRMKEQILPTFNKIFSKEFKEGFDLEDLRRGNLRYIAIHELAHSFLFYRNAVDNLKDLYDCIYELAATVLGLRVAGSLLLKDVITEKQLESMIVAFICRGFYLSENVKYYKSLVNYATGGIIFINFLLESGALKQKEGMAIPNFVKIFVSIHDLSFRLEQLLSSGSRKDAEVFIKKYGHFKNI